MAKVVLQDAIKNQNRFNPELDQLLIRLESGNAAIVTEIMRDMHNCLAAVAGAHERSGVNRIGDLVNALFSARCSRWLVLKANETSKDKIAASQEYAQLIVSLASINVSFVEKIATTLVELLIPAEETSMKDNSYLAVQHAIVKLTTICPSSLGVVASHIRRRFPHQSTQTWKLRGYMINCLNLSVECRPILADLMDAIISRLIALDVEIKLDQLPDAADDCVFEMDEMTLKDKAGNQGRGQWSAEQAEMVNMADKLDCLMLDLFDFCSARLSKTPGDVDPFMTAFFDVLMTQVHINSSNLLLRPTRRQIEQSFKPKRIAM
eukprot:c16436_g1_i1.p1 GENE.c16436_g1_i1~~c16436_g1_i1.p1  ORF type:complete len:321 (+),score=79.50 c16436_g1_i1:34-996(+)